MLELALCLAIAQIPVSSAAAPTQSSGVVALIAEVLRSGSVIVPGIAFEAGTDSLSAGSQPALRDLRALLVEHDEWTFEVQVHTTELGEPARDRALSDARARTVVTWLTREGITAARLVPRGYGSSTPLRQPVAGDSRLTHDRVELKKLNEE